MDGAFLFNTQDLVECSDCIANLLSGRRAPKTFGPKDVGGDELKYNSSCYNSDQFFLLQQMSISSILNDVLMF
jgi:hypothetical protein